MGIGGFSLLQRFDHREIGPVTTAIQNWQGLRGGHFLQDRIQVFEARHFDVGHREEHIALAQTRAGSRFSDAVDVQAAP